jgi:hypothetical protein
MVIMSRLIRQIFVPRILIDSVHEFRVKLNPIYAEENYETDLVIDTPLKKLIEIMEEWGCEINHPNQYKYPNQVASGHLYLNNGKQFHLRVYKHSKGLMIKGHIEWHGVTHPIRHIMYANLDYAKGYRMLKSLTDKSGINILFDKGKGIYDIAEKVIKSKKKYRLLSRLLKAVR